MQAFNGFGGWRFYFCFIERPKLNTGIEGRPIGNGGGCGITNEEFVDGLFWEFNLNDS